MLSVVMLNVVMLSVGAPNRTLALMNVRQWGYLSAIPSPQPTRMLLIIRILLVGPSNSFLGLLYKPFHNKLERLSLSGSSTQV
jgi:hypothetical protein